MTVSLGVIGKLKSSEIKLTKSEKKLSEYILNNKEKVIYKTVTEISKLCGVGEATIIRFCRKLGYKGFQDFKVSFAKEISLTQNNVLSGPIDKDDSIETIARKFYTINLEVLKQTMSILDYDKITKCTEAILKAKKVHFMGIGHSGITSEEAKYKFMRIGLNCNVYGDGHTMLMMASIMDKDDLIVAISHSGNTPEIIKAVKLAKENGAKVMYIGTNENSQIASMSDFCLYYVSKETLFQTGAVSTKIAQIFIIDLIYTEVVRSTLDTATEKKIKTAKTIEKIIYNRDYE